MQDETKALVDELRQPLYFEILHQDAFEYGDTDVGIRAAHTI